MTRVQHKEDELVQAELLSGGKKEEEFANTLERWDSMVMRKATAEAEEIIPPVSSDEPVSEAPASVATPEPIEQPIPSASGASRVTEATTEQSVTTGHEPQTEPRKRKRNDRSSAPARPAQGQSGVTNYSISFQANLGGRGQRRRQAPKAGPKQTISYRTGGISSATGGSQPRSEKKAAPKVVAGTGSGKEQAPVTSSAGERKEEKRDESKRVRSVTATEAAAPGDGSRASDRRQSAAEASTASETEGSGGSKERRPDAGQDEAVADRAGPVERGPAADVSGDVDEISQERMDSTSDHAEGSDEESYEAIADSIVLPALPAVDESLNESERASRGGYRRSMFIGFLLLILGLGGFMLWASTAPLKSGSVAIGSVKLAGERKTVQHLEGGIIKEIFVKEGDQVEEGQVLIRLEGKSPRAILRAKTLEYYTLLARRARLLSEKEGREDIEFPRELLEKADNSKIRDMIEREKNLFESRRISIADQLNLFDSWSEGYKREIDGIKAQRTAARKQLATIQDELQAVETLYKKGLIDKPRLLALKRTAAGLKGQIGSYNASISRIKQKISEADLRGITLQTQRNEEIANELQEVDANIRQLREQLPALVDRVKRLDIVAPRTGRVVNLLYHTPGGVISPSKPIMDIVPDDDKLIIEARINPTDIDIVNPGVEAQIQLTAYNQRQTPQLPGRVTNVSADRLEDPKTGDSYYLAMIEIDQDALKKLANVKLYPGMPASVQIIAGERTPLDYLLAPLESSVRRTWLEQ